MFTYHMWACCITKPGHVPTTYSLPSHSVISLVTMTGQYFKLLILLGIREVISCFVSAVAQTLGLYYCIHGIVPVTEKDCTWSLHQRTRGARARTVAVLKASWAQGQLAERATELEKLLSGRARNAAASEAAATATE